MIDILWKNDKLEFEGENYMHEQSQMLLRDSNIKPTDNLIADCLGETNEVYKKFLEDLKAYNVSLMEWKFYNDGKAWLSKGEYKWTTTRGTNKTKPIFWISIWDGFFKISFNFSEKTKDELLHLPISADTKEYINNIKPNGNKMKFLSVIFDVDNDKQFDDILLLSQFRKENI